MRHQSAIAVIVASLLTTACVPPGPGPMRPMPYGYNSGAMPPAHWDCNGGCISAENDSTQQGNTQNTTAQRFYSAENFNRRSTSPQQEINRQRAQAMRHERKIKKDQEKEKQSIAKSEFDAALPCEQRYVIGPVTGFNFFASWVIDDENSDEITPGMIEFVKNNPLQCNIRTKTCAGYTFFFGDEVDILRVDSNGLAIFLPMSLWITA